MPIEPKVFLCYGRPDRPLALSIARELWKDRVEAYNYLAKPVEDRIGGELPYLAYIPSARLFVAILSTKSIWRQPVVEEILYAQKMAKISEGRIRRVFIATPAAARKLPFSESDFLIDQTKMAGPADIAHRLIEAFGTEEAKKCRKSWEINKNLYRDAWEALNREYGSEDRVVRALPSAREVLSSVLGSTTIESYINEELARIRDVTNKWQFVLFVQEVVQYVGPAAASGLRSAARAYGRPDPRFLGLAEDVEAKTYSPDEAIKSVSQAIRGVARIVNALNDSENRRAFDIAARFTWQATRTVLLCGIYACSMSIGDTDVAGRILKEISAGKAG